MGRDARYLKVPPVLPTPVLGQANLAELEMLVIQDALRRHQGKGCKERVAKELGISLKTLYNKLNKEFEDESTRSASTHPNLGHYLNVLSGLPPDEPAGQVEGREVEHDHDG